jgi:hypothetical protein
LAHSSAHCARGQADCVSPASALFEYSSTLDQRTNRQNGTNAKGAPNYGLFQGGHDPDELLTDAPREEKRYSENGEAKHNVKHYLFLRHPYG